MSVKSTSPNISLKSSSSTPLNLTSHINHKGSRPTSSNNSMIHTCSWCETTTSNLTDQHNSFIQTHNHNQTSSSTDKIIFCSERCFESSRRASFKRGKTCDWCGDMTNNNKLINDSSSSSQKSSSSTSELTISPSNTSDAQTKVSLDRLQFCTEVCLTNYKQNIFERETSVVLFNPKPSVESQEIHVHKRPIKNLSNKTNTHLSAFKATNRKCKINKSTKRILSNHFHNNSTTTTTSTTNNNNYNITNADNISINKTHFPLNISDYISNNPTILSNPSQTHLTNNKPQPDPKIPFPTLISPPVYIPIPIPIPIPIFKNAPEILEILHKFGYKPTKSPADFSTIKSQNSNPTNPLITHKTNTHFNEIFQKCAKTYNESTENHCEPQNEALDLTKTFSSPKKFCQQKSQLNHPSALSLASILQLNDPYLKRRNRILDAPIELKELSSSSNNTSHFKNYCFPYLSESISNINNNNNSTSKVSNKQDNTNINNHHNTTRNSNSLLKHLKRRIERHNNINNTSTSNVMGKYTSLRNKLAIKNPTIHNSNNFPQQTNMQNCNTTSKVSNSTTSSNLLRRYPLLSMRRNIKSAPSSIFNNSSTAKK